MFPAELRPSIAARQAQALLRAWVCGDLPRLQAELERSTYMSSVVEGHAESDRLELLKSVAYQMKVCPDLYAQRTNNPQLGICVDLLMHLADCSPTPIS